MTRKGEIARDRSTLSAQKQPGQPEGCPFISGVVADLLGEVRLQLKVICMTYEPTIEQLLAPSTVLSRALEFMQTDTDADTYDVISAWVSRAIREIRADVSRARAIDQEALEGRSAARMKIESGKLWLRIFEKIQGAITPYGSEWQP